MRGEKETAKATMRTKKRGRTGVLSISYTHSWTGMMKMMVMRWRVRMMMRKSLC